MEFRVVVEMYIYNCLLIVLFLSRGSGSWVCDEKKKQIHE